MTERHAQADRVVAAADIGSNSFHLLVARLHEANAPLEPLHDESEMLLIGERIAQSGVIAPDVETQIVATLVRFRAIADSLGAEPFLVVATQAVRRATNGQDVVARISRSSGVPIAVITAEQETRLAVGGAYGGILPKSALFADSGGGSTQIAAIVDGQIAWLRSLPIGASGLTGVALGDDPPTPAQRAHATAIVEQAIATLPAPPRQRPGAQRTGGDKEPLTTPILVGGTATTISASGIGGCEHPLLTEACLARAEELLCTRPSSLFVAERALRPQRARVLCGGCIIVRHLIAWSRAPEWQASSAGLRDGMLRAWQARPEQWLDG